LELLCEHFLQARAERTTAPESWSIDTVVHGATKLVPGAGKLVGSARRAVAFLRGRRRRGRQQHVDVTESGTTAADGVKTMSWRQRLDAVFAETVDINQVCATRLHVAYLRLYTVLLRSITFYVT